ncbi:MAG TPA: hypothetical protein PLQ76_10025, partial [bacterium]|nr:hypothetical protein [bacterium]
MADIRKSGLSRKDVRNVALTAGYLEYDRLNKWMRLDAMPDINAIFVPGVPIGKRDRSVSMESRVLSMNSKQLFLDFNVKSVRASGNVKIIKRPSRNKAKKDSKFAKALGKKTTLIESDMAMYFWKQGMVTIPSPMTLSNKDFVAKSSYANINTASDTADMGGGVFIEQKKGGWLIDGDIVSKNADEDLKKAVTEPAKLSAMGLSINFASDTIQAAGPVIFEQKDRHLSGGYAFYDGVKDMWEISSGAALREKDYGISAGSMIYTVKDGRFNAAGAVFADMVPGKDTRNDIVEYFRDRDGNADEKSFEREQVRVAAESLIYNDKKDVLKAKGDARLTYKDVTVSAENIYVDYGKKRADGSGDVRFEDSRNEASAAKFTIDWDERVLHLEKDVKFNDKGRSAAAGKDEAEPFSLESAELNYSWKKREGSAEGGVKVRASEREANARKIVFDRQAKTSELTGGVTLKQESGEWLVKRGSLDDSDEKTKKIAMKPTEIYCESLFTDDDSGKAVFSGGVII